MRHDHASPKTTAVPLPESDGEPMAENTLQFEWIVALQGNLDLLFRDRPDVFVAGDHLVLRSNGTPRSVWPPTPMSLSDGRKGHRGSYAVCEEGGIFPQVIFEVWSPSNRTTQMNAKREFYEKYGTRSTTSSTRNARAPRWLAAAERRTRPNTGHERIRQSAWEFALKSATGKCWSIAPTASILTFVD